MEDGNREKHALLLGDIAHEGITSALRSSGLDYTRKLLHSSVDNWERIVELLDEGGMSMVLAKFSPATYCYFADNEYADVAGRLLARVGQSTNAVYVFEDLLAGINLDDGPTEDDIIAAYSDSVYVDSDHMDNLISHCKSNVRSFYENEHGYYLPSAVWQKAHERIQQSHLTLFPYRTRAEVTLSAQAFVEETGDGLIFRLYVPSGRMWEGEIGRLISLFRDYLAKTARASVRLDQTHTNHGVIYAFFGQEVVQNGDLSRQFEEFTYLLDLSINDPSAAEAILKQKDLDPQEIIQILSRYSKEARRLQIDMRHERETKLLAIRQRMESELVDAFPFPTGGDMLMRIADSVVPSISGLRSSLLPSFPSLPAWQQTEVTVNINPQIIQKMEGIVAQQIYGDANLGMQDRELIQLFTAYGEDSQEELVSSLHELNDESAPKTERLTSKQKIMRFLIGVRSRIGDMAFGLLQSYIEKKMLGL